MRFERLTLIDVADSRANGASWKAIGEELNLTASEITEIRKSSAYRLVAGEVLAANPNIDVSVFGVGSAFEGIVVAHSESVKAEAESKVETMTTEETTEMAKEVASTEELEARLENLKARYTATFGEDLDGNEVNINDVEIQEVSTPTNKAEAHKDFLGRRAEAHKAFREAREAFETYADSENPDYAEVKRLHQVKQDAHKAFREVQ